MERGLSRNEKCSEVSTFSYKNSVLHFHLLLNSAIVNKPSRNIFSFSKKDLVEDVQRCISIITSIILQFVFFQVQF